MGRQLGWWNHTPVWLTQISRKLAQAAALPARASAPKPPEPRSIPLTFVEVDPTTPPVEAPADTRNYSSRNSRASNPDPKHLAVPKVDGKQQQVVRVMDNEKPKPFPLQPAPPKPQLEPKPTAPTPAPQTKPKTEIPGDLALLRPKEKIAPGQAQEATTEAARDRPRTLAAARAQKNMLTGQKMHQEGGSSSRGQLSIDARATPFGEYDAAFISAVEQCWHNLIEEHLGSQRPGKVVIDFRLTYDGRITDIKVQENEAGGMPGVLCQSAILNPAPYPRWPPQMRQTIAANFREIRFTFWYN